MFHVVRRVATDFCNKRSTWTEKPGSVKTVLRFSVRFCGWTCSVFPFGIVIKYRASSLTSRACSASCLLGPGLLSTRCQCCLRSRCRSLCQILPVFELLSLEDDRSGRSRALHELASGLTATTNMFVVGLHFTKFNVKRCARCSQDEILPSTTS